MTEELNFETLDLVGVLAGRDYPTHEVDLYFDEALGFSVFTLQGALRVASLSGDEDRVKAIKPELDALIQKVKGSRYVATLKSIPEDLRRDILNRVESEFPTKTNFIGAPEANADQDAAYTKYHWQAYIQKITGPTGAVKVVDEADIDMLFNKAPASAQKALNLGIKELQEGSGAGFELAVKEIDFLSDASPEG